MRVCIKPIIDSVVMRLDCKGDSYIFGHIFARLEFRVISCQICLFGDAIRQLHSITYFIKCTLSVMSLWLGCEDDVLMWCNAGSMHMNILG
jgi:hypothetical protein